MTIDLTDKLMSPGAKRYQRLITSLKEWVPIKCDLMISSKMTGETLIFWQKTYYWLPQSFEWKTPTQSIYIMPIKWVILFWVCVYMFTAFNSTSYQIKQMWECLLLSAAEEDGGVLQNLLSQYSFEEHRPTLHTHTLKEMPCPSLHSTDRHGDEKSCDPHHFLEWLGAVSMDISRQVSIIIHF